MISSAQKLQQSFHQNCFVSTKQKELQSSNEKTLQNTNTLNLSLQQRKKFGTNCATII